MVNIEKAVNGWIIRGRDRTNFKPVTWVVYTVEELVHVIEKELEL